MKNKKRYWTDKETTWLKNNYLIKNINVCCRVLKRKRYQIYNKTKVLNLFKPPRLFRVVDLNKFYNIQSAEIAYFLGLSWADGHVRKNSKNSYNFQLALCKKDSLNIKNVMETIGNFGMYQRVKVGEKSKIKRKYISYYICYFPFCKFLEKMDYCIKSYSQPTKILSKIPEHLKHYFWRGYFDGDGCLYIKYNIYKRVMSISGPYNYNWNFFKKLAKKYNIKFAIKKEINNKGKSSKIIVGKTESLYNFFSYIYKDREKDEIGLNRKYKKWLKLLKLIKRKNYIIAGNKIEAFTPSLAFSIEPAK